MIYLQLFFAFLQIGAFSFGGGYAAMPLIEEQVINTYHWMTMSDFSDLVTIAEMTPGPIAMIFSTGLKILIPALFASGAISFVSGNFQVRIFLYFLFGLAALRKLKFGPIKTMVCRGAAEVVFQLLQTFA